MTDRFINWPPPKEALIPLVEALARAMVAEEFRAAKEARRAAAAIAGDDDESGSEPDQPKRKGRRREAD